MKRWLYLLGVIIVASFGLSRCTVINSEAELSNSKGKFANSEIDYNSGLGDIWKISKMYFTAKRNVPEPQLPVPVKPISIEQLLAGKEDIIYRLGHSTILMRLDGELILIDPVFNDRASPVQWIGPKRFHQPPILLAQLPQIKAVIISHDHYDHLEQDAIIALKDKTEHFLTPLKVGERMINWGVDKNKVTELDWWQEAKIDSFTFVATPAQHFSGRGIFDRDKTLWASWVVQSSQSKLFYTGDTGYFGGFKQIGERYGPFDITIVETGAYNDMWSEIHMLPEQSVQAHIDLKGKAMMPVHNGTFDLSLHDWYEPFERVLAASQQHQVQLLTPIFGEGVNIVKPQSSHRWWLDVIVNDENSAITQARL